MTGHHGPPSAAALGRVLEVTRRLAAPFDLTTMLAEVIEAGKAVLGADRGTVFLYDENSHELYSTVATGIEALRFSADRGIVGECVRTRQVINVPDCYADPRFNRDVDRQSGYRTRCLLTLPLIGHASALVGVLQLLNKENGVFDAGDEPIAAALAAQCAVALQRVRMTEALVVKERLERELEVARQIQMKVLPRELPGRSGYDLAGTSRPADQTGDDAFDVISLDRDRLMLLLSDATGHGIGPAISVTQVRAMLRIAMRLGADLDTTCRHINDQLVDDLAANRFVTAFLGILDPGSHQVTYHSGGQGPLMHFHAAAGTFDWHGASTVPMGFMPQARPKPACRLDLAPGDILGLMTDGIYECENPGEEAFGEPRVESLVRQHHDAPMERLVERLMGAADEFRGAAPQADDITLLLVRRLPA